MHTYYEAEHIRIILWCSVLCSSHAHIEHFPWFVRTKISTMSYWKMLCARLYIITCRLQAFITRTQCTAQYTKRSLTHSQMHLTHPLARDESFQIIYFIPSLLMRLFLICFSLFWLSLLLLRRSGIICTLYIYHSILLYIHSNISVDDYIFDIHPKIGSIIIIAK